MAATNFMHDPQLLVTKNAEQKKNSLLNINNTTNEKIKSSELFLMQKKKSFLNKKLNSTLSSAHMAITNGVKLIDNKASTGIVSASTGNIKNDNVNIDNLNNNQQQFNKSKRKLSNLSCNASTLFSAVNNNPISAERKSSSINENLGLISNSKSLFSSLYNKNYKSINSINQISLSQTTINDSKEFNKNDNDLKFIKLNKSYYNPIIINNNNNKIYKKRQSLLSIASSISMHEQTILEKRKLSNISIFSDTISQKSENQLIKLKNDAEIFPTTNSSCTTPTRVPITYNSQFCVRQHLLQHENLEKNNQSYIHTNINQ